ncbi:MAG TPA: hypothetical protein VH640_11245 [Bryobacteraceae bacterium]|jgi:hypothetical protein
MKMRKEWVFAAIALGAGFVGGAVSSGLHTVFAQQRATEITAERFVVVDSKAVKRGELGVDLQGRVVLNLYSENGRVLWSAPARTGILPAGPVGPSQ